MALRCDHCAEEITDTVVIVPNLPEGNAHYHALRDCARAAQVKTTHAWGPRRRKRRLREALYGPGGSVS